MPSVDHGRRTDEGRDKKKKTNCIVYFLAQMESHLGITHFVCISARSDQTEGYPSPSSPIQLGVKTID